MLATPKCLTGDKKAIQEFIDKFDVRQLIRPCPQPPTSYVE
jgi:hypothetical protein